MAAVCLDLGLPQVIPGYNAIVHDQVGVGEVIRQHGGIVKQFAADQQKTGDQNLDC